MPPDAAPALEPDFEPPPILPMGSVVAQRYSIIELIGHGGMGLVYKAQQIHLEQVVALKMLLAECSAASADYRRFQREAQAASRLDHPNIVKIHDFGFSDGQAYLCMDHIEGRSLEGVLQEAPLNLDTFRHIFKQTTDALQHAHDNGMVHRDLKPSNLMLSWRNGDPLFLTVLDFGLVKMLHGSIEQKLTATDMLVGSPLYMSPEQCQGLNLDHRSDIYSLGCVMYEALAGFPPLQAENFFDVMNKHVSATPVSFREAVPGIYVPPALERAIMKAMSKNPADRQQSMMELSAEIERSFSGAPDPVFANASLVSSRQDKLVKPQRRRRSPWKLIASGAGVLACVLLLISSGILIDELIRAQRRIPEKNLPTSLSERMPLTVTEGRVNPAEIEAGKTAQPVETRISPSSIATTIPKSGEQQNKERQSELKPLPQLARRNAEFAGKDLSLVKSVPVGASRQASSIPSQLQSPSRSGDEAPVLIRHEESQASDGQTIALARLACTSFNQRDYKATKEYLTRFKEKFLFKPKSMENEDFLLSCVLIVCENMPGGEDFDLSEKLIRAGLEAFTGTNQRPTRKSVKMLLELSRLYVRMDRRHQGNAILQEALRDAQDIDEQDLVDEIKAEMGMNNHPGPKRGPERGFEAGPPDPSPGWGPWSGRGTGLRSFGSESNRDYDYGTDRSFNSGSDRGFGTAADHGFGPGSDRGFGSGSLHGFSKRPPDYNRGFQSKGGSGDHSDKGGMSAPPPMGGKPR